MNADSRRPRAYFTAILLIVVLCSGCTPNASKSGGSGSGTTSASTLTVCAASDLKFALDDLLGDFRKQEPGLSVTATYGSSGNFYQQLKNEAPFDVYLSADIDYVRKLNAGGLIEPDSLFQYAEGRVVVWVRNDSKLDLGQDGKQALTDPAVNKIAIANPQHAPYGRAAVAALKKFGLYDQLESKFVFGENISQTAQFIESGAADVGIIALSLAIAPTVKDKGRYVEIPADAHSKLDQAGAILKWATDKDAASRFCKFLTGPEGRNKLKLYGFVMPGE